MSTPARGTTLAEIPAETTRSEGATIEVRHASRWYGNVVAVNDISFDLGPGITGLLGANGAGKSTVLAMVAGLLAPSRGEVLVHGRSARGDPDVYRTMALVPERESVHEFLTGWELVLAAARLQRLRDPESLTRRAIDAVQLSDAQHRRIGTYSKGMRQRARIASALVHDPRVLLLDEPFNGLDPRQRLQMMQFLRRFASEGRTVLFSSHILEEVEQVATDVLVLVAGRLAAWGRPREIRRLMTQRPHTFRLRSNDDRRLASALLTHASVTGVELEANGVTVRTSDRGAFTRALPSISRQGRFTIRELQPMDESLESVFSYLVNR